MSPTYPNATAVWALIDGYPWWPAHVVRPRELCLGPKDVPPAPASGEILVEFFNDGHRFAVLPLSRVRPFLPTLPAPNAAYTGPLSSALRAAVLEAKRYAHDRPYAIVAQSDIEHIPVRRPNPAEKEERVQEVEDDPEASGDEDDSEEEQEEEEEEQEEEDEDEEDEEDEPMTTSRPNTRARAPDAHPRRRQRPRRASQALSGPRRVTRRTATQPPQTPPPRTQTTRTTPAIPRRTRASDPGTPRKRRRVADAGDKEGQASPTHLDDVVDEASSSAGEAQVAKEGAAEDARAAVEDPREEDGGEPQGKEEGEGDQQKEGVRQRGSEEEQNGEPVVDLVTEDTRTDGARPAPASEVGATSAKERSKEDVPCEEMVTEDGDDLDDAEQTMVHRETDTANEGDVYQILSKDQVISLLVAREREIRAYYHQNQVLQRRIKQLESGDLLRRGQDLFERCQPLFDDVNKFLSDSVSKGRLNAGRR